MFSKKIRVVLVGAVLALPACSFTEEALWPSLTPEDPAGAGSAAPAPPVAGASTVSAMPGQPGMGADVGAGSPPPLGSGNFSPDGVTPGQSTGTFVGKKVVELRDELVRLQDSIANHNAQLQDTRSRTVQDSQRYHTTVAAINSRLQVGTTPGNPILVQQFNSAQADLDRLGADITEMNNLATAVAADSTMSSFLSESARAAFSMKPGVLWQSVST